MPRRRSASLTLLALLLAGCGGSGDRTVVQTDPGNRVGPRLTIDWPARARGVSAPASANFAQIVAPGAGVNGGDASALVARPEGEAASSKTYTLPIALTPGTHVLRVDFYPTAPNSNVFPSSQTAVVASVTLNVQVLNDGTLQTLDGKPLGSVAVETKIATVVLNPFGVEIGEKADPIVAATNAQGQYGALPPGGVTFAIVSGADRLRLNADNSFTGLSAGSAIVTATVDGVTSEPVTVSVLDAPITALTLSIQTTALVSNQSGTSLYAALPSTTPNGNSVVRIDPASGSLGTPIFVGSGPSALGISDDGSTLFVGLSGSGTVRKVDLTTETAGAQFSLPLEGYNNTPPSLLDIAVQPGSKTTFAAIAAIGTSPVSVRVFDEGVPRPNALGTGNQTNLLWTNASRILSVGVGYTYGLTELSVDANGLTFVRNGAGTTSNTGRLVLAGSRVYDSAGNVYDASSLQRVGLFPLISTFPGIAPVVDDAGRRAYFIEPNGTSAVLSVFDTSSFTLVTRRRIADVEANFNYPYLQGYRFLRFGSNGLALELPDKLVFLDNVIGS